MMLINTRKILLASTATLSLLANGWALNAQDRVEQDGVEVDEEIVDGDVVVDEVFEEIVVTGVRRSLAAALDQKRDASAFVDAIAAEDISDFPDANISEALQRISGVTIERNNGEGELVSIRGLAPQFTRVTLNGLPVLANAINDDGNIQNGRATNFDVFPSELFSNAAVYKSPSAEQTEGGLAGIVDLNIPRAFNFDDDFTVSISGAARHNKLGDATNPEIAGLVSGIFMEGKLGVVLQAAYQEDLVFQQGSDGIRWFNTFDLDLDQDGTAELQDVEIARLSRLTEEFFPRERFGATGSIQFRPTDNFEATIDILYGRSKKQRNRHGFSLNTFGPFTVESVILDENNTAEQATFSNVRVALGYDFNEVNTENLILGGQFRWDISENWTVDAQLSYSEAEFDQVAFGIGALQNIRAAYDYRTDPQFPIFDFFGVNVLDPSLYTFGGNFNDRPRNANSDAVFTRLDLTREFDGDNGISSVSFGVGYNDQSYDLDTFRGRIANPLAGQQLTSDVLGSLRGPLFPGEGPDGFLREFLVFDREALEALLPASSDPAIRPQETYDVAEEIFNAYVQVNVDTTIAGMPLTGNVGLRYAHTDQFAAGFAQQSGVSQPVSFSRSYDDFLPSANFKLELSDDVLLRLSASRSVARPNLNEVAPSEIISAVNPTVTRGNPDLDPFRANSIDFGVEWYFAEESVFSLTVFYKDIEGYVTTQAVEEQFTPVFDPSRAGTFLVTTPINGDNANVLGLEATYQQPFSFLPAPFDGLGIFANLTYSDSELTASSVVGGETVFINSTLPGQSEISYNIIGYYEKGPFAVRLAYHYRDDYLTLILGGVEQRIVEGAGNLDASAQYNINENVAITFEALNLTSTNIYRFDRTPNRNQQYHNFGPTYTLGFRAKF